MPQEEKWNPLNLNLTEIVAPKNVAHNPSSFANMTTELLEAVAKAKDLLHPNKRKITL